jgi:hypothetical protein
VRAQRSFCQMAVKSIPHSDAEAVRLLGVFTSAANRFAAFEELPESRRLLKMLRTYLRSDTSSVTISTGPNTSFGT